MQTNDIVVENEIKIIQKERTSFSRPKLIGIIRRVDYSFWKIFSKYHYLTEDMNKSAQCFCLFIDERPVSFMGVTHFPHPKVKNIKRITRGVTLPDWQGMGVAFKMGYPVISAYAALGFKIRTYPAHPSFIRSFQHQPDVWKMVKKPGLMRKESSKTSSVKWNTGTMMSRQCAVFEYIGPKMEDIETAGKLINSEKMRG
jgi:hypothetical protein